MLMKDFIVKLQQALASADPILGEPEIMLDVFTPEAGGRVFEYMGFSPIIPIEYTSGYFILSAFEEDQQKVKAGVL